MIRSFQLRALRRPCASTSSFDIAAYLYEGQCLPRSCRPALVPIQHYSRGWTPKQGRPSQRPGNNRNNKPREAYQQQKPQDAPLHPPNPPLDPSAANPPASTRPPPLDVPARDPSASTISHLFRVGKAYLTFYKTGLRQILTNTRLVRALNKPDRAAKLDVQPPAPDTRAARLLRERWRHDISRLPLFALLLLVCGEFTPLVVIAVPAIVPLTCRLPAQQRRLLRKAEARRAASFAALPQLDDATRRALGAKPSAMIVDFATAPAHMCRSLGITSPLLDRLGTWVPRRLAYAWSAPRVQDLARDDMALQRAGGVDALEGDEVRLACIDRGIDVLQRDGAQEEWVSEAWLRSVLTRWLEWTTAQGRYTEDADVDPVSGLTLILLNLRPEAWPSPEGRFKTRKESKG